MTSRIDYGKPEVNKFLRPRRLRYHIAAGITFALIWFVIGFLAGRMT